MSKHTGPTNPLLQKLIQDLKKKSFEINSPFLMDVAEKLNKPRRQRIEVNLNHIERYTQKGETIVVPGVVLGYGDLTKPITISAWKFSKSALKKIREIKANAISIEALVDKNPKGTDVKLLS